MKKVIYINIIKNQQHMHTLTLTLTFSNSHKMHPFILFPLLISFLVLLWPSYKWAQNKNKNKNKKCPPSPPKLPILGNLHQLGSLPHQSLHALSLKHGPMMLLHFGSVPVLIASSADAAREIMRTHDLTFAYRPEYKAFMKLVYGGRDVTVSPYGEYWRQMKSFLVLHLLSNKRVQSFRSIKEQETALFLKKIEQSEGPVNLSEMFAEFANDVICRSAFGTKYRESDKGKKLLELLAEFMVLLGDICVGDFIPWLGWIDRVRGFDSKLDVAAKAMDEFLEDVIQERIDASKGRDDDKNGENFIDSMLRMYSEKEVIAGSIARVSIKALVLDVLIGGTDTISTTIEWVMTELLRHPRVLEKLQDEIREIVEDSRGITDDEIFKMHYLKAVIRETLRYHPPLPLLSPRVASKDVTIKGYNISAGTVTMINAWTIGRDAATWDDAHKFWPERFLNSSIDFKGLDFELIPFGAGRRGCPGITYAVVAMEFLLANIVHKFNWKLGDGAQGEDLDILEAPGIIIHRATPLLVVATKSL